MYATSYYDFHLNWGVLEYGFTIELEMGNTSALYETYKQTPTDKLNSNLIQERSSYVTEWPHFLKLFRHREVQDWPGFRTVGNLDKTIRKITVLNIKTFQYNHYWSSRSCEVTSSLSYCFDLHTSKCKIQMKIEINHVNIYQK